MQPAPGPLPDGPAALDRLRSQILGVDETMRDLISQRQALVDEYERIRFALTATTPPAYPLPQASAPPAAPPRVQEWSAARVRGLLLGLGAALLAISALAFTAVAWSRLDEGGRAALLIGMTAVVTALALLLRRRLPASAEALAGLAVVLSLIDVYALRRAGASGGVSWEVWWAIGTAAAAAFAAALGLFVGARTTRLAVAVLAPVSAELLLTRFGTPTWVAASGFAALAAAVTFARVRLGPRLAPREHGVLQLHAVGCWLAAALLAVTAAGLAQSTGASVGPAFAVAMLAAAPAVARRDSTDAGLRAVAATLIAAVPAGVVLTLAAPALSGQAMLTAAVVSGGAIVVASRLAPAALRGPALVAGAAFAVPGIVAAVATALPSVFLPLAWLDQPWTGDLALSARDAAEGPGASALSQPAFSHESWPAVGTLLTVVAVGLALAIGNRAWLGLTTAAMAFAAALAPPTAGASILTTLMATTTAAVVALLAAALVDRSELRQRLALLPGVAIAAAPATGWAAVTPTASVATLAVGAAAAGAATLIARPVPAARSVFAALAVALVVGLAGVATDATGAGAAAGGFAAALTAGLLVLAGVHLGRYAPAAGATVEAAGVVCAAGALAVAARSTPWLAGALTALVPVAAQAAMRRRAYAAGAGALALAAVWAWLSAANVSVVEAYTAPAAAAALAAGLLGWRSGRGRSWTTLGPALVLAIGPTLALGLADEDASRLIAAAVLSFAAVVAGAVLRLLAPLAIGAAALLILAIDQWGEEIVRAPRWITLGVIGVALMWIGATFEHRRRDWRNASDVFGRFG